MATEKELTLASVKPSTAIVRLAVPATLALLAKAVYNIVDTAYIGMLDSDTALAAVGVTLPLLLIMVSLENIFAAGAAVLAGRQLGAGEKEEMCIRDRVDSALVAMAASDRARSTGNSATWKWPRSRVRRKFWRLSPILGSGTLILRAKSFSGGRPLPIKKFRSTKMCIRDRNTIIPPTCR